MFKSANIDAAWIRHGAEGSLGRCINSCSFWVVPRWRECLPPLLASISLLCSSRLGQQSCALWSRILGPWTLKGAESTEEVSCDTGNWNHKDIRHIGTPKKETVAFCCILSVFKFHYGLIMFHDISRHILSHILNMRRGLRQNPHDLRVDDFPESPGFYHQAWISGCALSLSLGMYCICVVFIGIYIYVQICASCRYINSYDAAGRFERRKLAGSLLGRSYALESNTRSHTCSDSVAALCDVISYFRRLLTIVAAWLVKRTICIFGRYPVTPLLKLMFGWHHVTIWSMFFPVISMSFETNCI